MKGSKMSQKIVHKDNLICYFLFTLGRDVLLHDCDGFTREYFRKVHDKLLEPLDLGEDVKKKREKEIPPYTGIGTEADSLTSCGGLEPRPPQR